MSSHIPEIAAVEDEKTMSAITHNLEASDEKDGRHVDPVFGEQIEGDVVYTSMGWMKATVVLLKCQIALGVLSMPLVLTATGAVPGAIIILSIGIFSTWSDYYVGVFKINHPEVYGVGDAGYVLAGAWGREIFTYSYLIFMIAITGVGFVPVAEAFQVLTNKATCSVVWVVLAMVVTFCVSSIQTLNRVSIVGWIGFTFIITAIWTLVIAVAVQDRPSDAPQTGPWDKAIVVSRAATYLEITGAFSTAIFGYCGTPIFFGIVSEMKNPRHFTRSIAVCQTIVTITYTTIGIMVYCFCGQYLSVPAFGSAGPLMKKICYGIALPGLFASVIIYCHTAAKVIFVKALRGTRHLTAPSKIHWAVWLSSTAGVALIAFILAESIPFFGSLAVFLGGLFGSAMCLQMGGWMWLHDNWKRRHFDRSKKFILMCIFNWFLVVFGSIITVSGTVQGGISIRDSLRAQTTKPFSCA